MYPWGKPGQINCQLLAVCLLNREERNIYAVRKCGENAKKTFANFALFAVNFG